MNSRTLVGGFLFAVMVALGLAAVSTASANGGPNRGPGLLDDTPVEAFATSPGTSVACRMLRQGHKAAGIRALRGITKEHPEDLVAEFALTQAATIYEQHRLLAERKEAVRTKDTPIREFKLGVVAWCLQTKAKYGWGVYSGEEPALSQIASTALRKVGKGSRDPFLWYFVGVAASDTPGLDQAAAFDTAIEILLGPDQGAKYEQAKHAGWRGGVPTLPTERGRLVRIQYILHDCIWTRCVPMGHIDVTVDRAGHSTTKRWREPLRPEQAAAQRYFEGLLAKIKDRIGQPN